MGVTEILVSGGVAAILAAVVGGGMKAFGVEMPLLASVQRQILVLAVGVGLIALGLLSAGRPVAGAGAGATGFADGPAPANAAAAETPATAAAPAGKAPAPAGKVAESAIPDIPNIVEMPYSAARRFLMSSGWTPIYPASSPMANSDLGFRGPEIFETGYFEAVSCSGTGMAPCLFRYRNSRGYVLEVVTIGENDLRQASVNSARVLDCHAEPRPEAC